MSVLKKKYFHTFHLEKDQTVWVYVGDRMIRISGTGDRIQVNAYEKNPIGYGYDLHNSFTFRDEVPV